MRNSLFVFCLICIATTALADTADESIYREDTFHDGEYVKFTEETDRSEIRSTAQEIVGDYTRSLSNKCTGSPYYGSVINTDVSYGSVKTFCILNCVFDQMVTVHVTCRYRDTRAEQRRERYRTEDAEEVRAAQSTRQAKQKIKEQDKAARQERAERFCESSAKQGATILCSEKNGTVSSWSFSGTVVPSQAKIVGKEVCPRSRLNGELLSCDFGPRGMHFYKKLEALADEKMQEDSGRHSQDICFEEEANSSQVPQASRQQ